jgi:hypothetical protein
LTLLALVIAIWIFSNPVFSTALRGGLSLAAWGYGGELHIDQLSIADNGWIQARGITWLLGPPDHRSSFKSDAVGVRLSSWKQLLHLSEGGPQRLVREMMVGKTKILLDTRSSAHAVKTQVILPVRNMLSLVQPSLFLPSASFTLGSADLVMIGDHHRVAVNGLSLRLPDRWAGRISYSDGSLDVGAWHRVLPKTSVPASWEGGTLRLGELDLGNELLLRETTLRPVGDSIDFGIRGTVGQGLIRGDGTVSSPLNPKHLELTLVGEGLALDAFREWMKEEKKATGVISQARLTFRGDPTNPVDADSSLRVIARDFRWEGKGWETLRLVATLTGRNLTLSELHLQQQENEVTASGQSHLPSDWHAALRAPFTGKFHAELEDASALAGLAGPEFTQLGGGLLLEGEIHGSENKAEGYCNLSGAGMTIRKLPLDWVKGCMIFAGDQTRLASLEAWSGRDHLNLSGQVANSRPHAYKAEAQADVRDLTKRLSQLGVTTASVIGGGAVKFRWHGEGTADVHTGSFEMEVNDWVSKWTTTGMTGTFEGSYAPGKVELSKAKFKQDDLTLGGKLSAAAAAFRATDIVATRAGKPGPLVKGDILLPFNALEFWQSGDLLKTIAMDSPVDINLALQGIKAEEIAGLLGQQIPFVGTLDGSITAKGSPAKPVIHSALSIRNFSPKQGGPKADLSIAVEAGDGKASAKLLQEPASTSPLSVELAVPLHLIKEQGTICMGDTDQPIHGSATFQHVPLDGWVSLMRLDSWPLKNARVDGKILFSGAWRQPALEGGFLLEAEEGHLFGSHTLEHLSLPITLSSAKAVFGSGSAVYRDKPVMLSGELSWEQSPWKGGLRLQGKDLPLTLGSGLEALADADLVFGATTPQTPLLSGSLQLHGLTGVLHPELTPSFAPPACLLSSSASESSRSPASDNGLKNLQIDLSLRTDGLVSLDPQTNSALALDVQAGGAALDPSFSGTVQGKNMELTLPCGPFYAPQVRVLLKDSSYTLSGDDAYGLTKGGFCFLSLNGVLPHPKIAFEGEPGDMAPDLLMAIATGRAEWSKRYLTEGSSWCRQSLMFPLPATKWMTSRMGEYEPGTQGFYGAPWIWNISWGGAQK